MSVAPLSICILRLSAIGDVCNAVSVVQALQRHFPQATITWVVGKVEARLLERLPGIELVVFDKSQGLRSYRNLYQSLKGRRFDVLLQMQLALRANLASACIRARRRIGFDAARSKELHSLFINERIAPATGMHVLDGFRQFADALGVPEQPPVWRFPLTEQERAWAREQCGARSLVIAPAASAAERNWLPERYAVLAKHAQQQGFRVLLCGGPAAAEKALAQTIVEHSISQGCAQPLVNLVGQTSLQQLLALLAETSLVVAPDTGPAHLAGAVGTPVVGLYAHSNPQRTGPYLWQQYVVDAYHRNLQRQTGKTAEQFRWGKRLKGDDLMADIGIDEVLTMFDRVVQEQGL